MEMAAPLDSTLLQVQKRLQDGGEWDRIYALLNELLNESGWVDELYDSAKENSRQSSTPITQLLSELGPKSKKSIPPEVRQRVIEAIKEAIERVVA